MIPVAKPFLGKEEWQAVQRPLSSGWVTQGPEVAAFEKEFAAFVGASHACAVSSCTTALHLALKAAGVEGGEVVTVSHSFIATANAVRYCDATPVFVDIKPGTFNIDPRLVEKAFSPRTRALLVVHQMGMPCDMRAILPAARRRKIPVVEDAACAVGSEILWRGRWEKIGKPHSDAACFSFHPRKLLTTGDGGMITTRHRKWDAQFRLWRQHGMSVPDVKRHLSKKVIFEEYTELGFNYRLTDIQAAIGREQLRGLPAVLQRRRHQVERYRKRLSTVSGLDLPQEPPWARSNWQSFCVRLPADRNQRRVMQRLMDQGISTRRGVMNAHRERAYRKEPWTCGPRALPGCRHAQGMCERLRESEKAQERSILLPLFHGMTQAQQDYVVESLRKACL